MQHPNTGHRMIEIVRAIMKNYSQSDGAKPAPTALTVSPERSANLAQVSLTRHGEVRRASHLP